MDIRIEDLAIEPDLQQRASIDQDHIDQMAEHLADPDYDLHPIGVVAGEQWWVWDGFQRIAAYKKAGRETIPAIRIQGDYDKAFDLSLGANSGLNRSSQDIEKVLRAAFARRADRSDREIARLTGLHHKTVGKYRTNLSGDKSPDAPTPRTVTRNGQTYEMDVSGIGRGKKDSRIEQARAVGLFPDRHPTANKETDKRQVVATMEPEPQSPWRDQDEIAQLADDADDYLESPHQENYDVYEDISRIRSLSETLSRNWKDDLTKQLIAQTYRQLANEVLI